MDFGSAFYFGPIAPHGEDLASFNPDELMFGNDQGFEGPDLYEGLENVATPDLTSSEENSQEKVALLDVETGSNTQPEQNAGSLQLDICFAPQRQGDSPISPQEGIAYEMSNTSSSWMGNFSAPQAITPSTTWVVPAHSPSSSTQQQLATQQPFQSQQDFQPLTDWSGNHNIFSPFVPSNGQNTYIKQGPGLEVKAFSDPTQNIPNHLPNGCFTLDQHFAPNGPPLWISQFAQEQAESLYRQMVNSQLQFHHDDVELINFASGSSEMMMPSHGARSGVSGGMWTNISGAKANRSVRVTDHQSDFSSALFNSSQSPTSSLKAANMGQEQSQIAAAGGHDVAKTVRRVPKTQTQNNTGSSWVPINSPSQQTASDTTTKTHTTTGTNEKKRKRVSKVGGDPGNSAAVSAAKAATEAKGGQNSLKPSPKLAKSTKPSPTAQSGLGISMVPTSPRKGSESASSGDSVIPSSRKVVAHPETIVKPKEKESSDEEDEQVNKEAQDLLAGFEAMDSDDDDEDIAGSPARAKTTPNIPHRQRPNFHPSTQNFQVTAQTFSKLPPTFAAAPNGQYSHNAQYAHFPANSPSPPSVLDDEGPLTAHEQAQLKDEGRFTKMEQSFLRDAITEYCNEHSIPLEQANDYVCGKARAGNIPADFWDEVCKALPQRTKNSIQRAAKRVFRNNQKKGPWTKEEEDALADAYKRNPDQWAKVCEEVPGRSAEQCRDRWRNYTQNGAQLTRGPWTDQEEAQFIEICKEMLSRARADQEAQRRAGRLVPDEFIMINHLNFTTISGLMGGARSRLHCRNKWHKLKKRQDIMDQIEAETTRKLADSAYMDSLLRPSRGAPPAQAIAPPNARPPAAVQPRPDVEMIDAPAERQTSGPVRGKVTAPFVFAPVSTPVSQSVRPVQPVQPIQLVQPVQPIRPVAATAAPPARAASPVAQVAAPIVVRVAPPDVKPAAAPDTKLIITQSGGPVGGQTGEQVSTHSSVDSKGPVIVKPATESEETSPVAENGRPARKKRKSSRLDD